MNLAAITNSRVGRHVLIYGFGASCLQVLKHTRTVIEGGFAILDRAFGDATPVNADIAAVSATQTAEQADAPVIPPPDHPYAYDDATIPPPPPSAAL